MKRTAIVLDKTVGRGEAANIAAILMGQIARIDPKLFEEKPTPDADGISHASVKYSIVALAGSAAQILSLAKSANLAPEVKTVAFSKMGQGLHNQFELYASTLAQSSAGELGIVGFGLTGDDALVRSMTKKFSLLA